MIKQNTCIVTLSLILLLCILCLSACSLAGTQAEDPAQIPAASELPEEHLAAATLSPVLADPTAEIREEPSGPPVAIVITVQPESAFSDPGDDISFFSAAEGFSSHQWILAAPDEREVVAQDSFSTAFPDLKTEELKENGGFKLIIRSVPETLNGWSVRCRFIGGEPDHETLTDPAEIHIAFGLEPQPTAAVATLGTPSPAASEAATPAPTPSDAPAYVQTPKATQSTSPAATATPAPAATPKPVATPKPTTAPQPTATPRPTATTAPATTQKPTATPVPSQKPTATPRPAATPIPTPKPTATPRPTQPTQTPAPTATPKPTATPRPTAAPSPTPQPTAAPKPTPTPLPTAPSQPTATPVQSPTPVVTPKPTATPTPTPTPSPTPTPASTPHVHTWTAHTTDVFVVDQPEWDQPISEWRFCCRCGAMFVTQDELTAHMLSFSDAPDDVWEQHSSWSGGYFVIGYEHHEAEGHYETQIDYYYCECGATKDP